VSLVRTCPIAGPSSLRPYATTTGQSSTTTSTSTTNGDLAAPLASELLESPRTSQPLSGRQLPPNVVFEGFEEGEGIEPKRETGGCE
jgi:hypothetical protein